METLKKHPELKIDGALVVTTPQALSVGDVRRELTFCKRVGLKVIGIVENMSGFVCPHCQECTNVFSKGGGKALAEHAGVPFLGCVPIDPKLAEVGEKGQSFLKQFENDNSSETVVALRSIAEKVVS